MKAGIKQPEDRPDPLWPFRFDKAPRNRARWRPWLSMTPMARDLYWMWLDLAEGRITTNEYAILSVDEIRKFYKQATLQQVEDALQLLHERGFVKLCRNTKFAIRPIRKAFAPLREMEKKLREASKSDNSEQARFDRV